ncbi:uncharacterized protein F5147DRAFT_146900 [Suillus discolor]|uniref:Uncharacterized protein n=1 Tax=Suillus discolor TaxID=1912936 RepID=A0A9P7F7E5_9AGAM|nr:uncharacterized protein F5147DRAFT_146900 [Suillus discolor]KAG2109619.1 hypothetical protein F5147DRAFT_146900 [Suillus discolor]
MVQPKRLSTFRNLSFFSIPVLQACGLWAFSVSVRYLQSPIQVVCRSGITREELVALLLLFSCAGRKSISSNYSCPIQLKSSFVFLSPPFCVPASICCFEIWPFLTSLCSHASCGDAPPSGIPHPFRSLGWSQDSSREFDDAEGLLHIAILYLSGAVRVLDVTLMISCPTLKSPSEQRLTYI